MAADSTYAPKVYRADGGNNITIKTGGTSGGTVQTDAADYTGTSSYQPLGVDLPLGGAVGGEGKKLAGVMGNVIDAATPATVTTKPIVAGVIGAYSLTAANSSTYPTGAIAAQISDGVNDTSIYGVVSYIDGDSATTIAGAAFKVMSNNSTAASGFHFGLDLQDASHDSYQAVDKDFYLSAPIRIVEDACILVTAGAPSDGVTADNIAGKGSLCIDVTNGKLYINTGTKADSTWVVVGTQT